MAEYVKMVKMGDYVTMTKMGKYAAFRHLGNLEYNDRVLVLQVKEDEQVDGMTKEELKRAVSQGQVYYVLKRKTTEPLAMFMLNPLRILRVSDDLVDYERGVGLDLAMVMLKKALSKPQKPSFFAKKPVDDDSSSSSDDSYE